MKAIRRSAAGVKPSRGILPQAPLDVLTQVGAVKLVYGLNYPLEQLARRALVQMFINRNDSDSLALEKGLVGNGINTTPRKAI